MSQVAAAEAVVVFGFLVALIGIWDGLIRRHIRLSIDVIQLHIIVRGILAIALGSLCLLLAVLFAQLIIRYTANAVTDCRGQMTCIAGRILTPPFTTWPTALITVIAVAVFANWASDALDYGGPYRRHLLAPGVSDMTKRFWLSLRAICTQAIFRPWTTIQ